jgi:Mrp family chromosome partitioning ATPase
VSIAEVKAQLPSARDKRSLNAELSALRTLYGIQQSDLQLKQRATPPNHAVSPKPLRDAGIGGVAGLLLALLLLGVLEALDRRLKSLADVDRDVQTGMLAVLPPTDPRKLGKGLIDARTVDAFQQLQANMMFASRDEDVRTIAVTSAVAKEGKSTLALGLAISLGGSGRRVLLIDADFRRPTISHVLGVRPGDSSLSLIEDPDRTPTPVRFDLRWVRGDAKPGVVFSNGAVKLQSFDFVSAGPVRTAAFNFFSTARFADYLHTCREAYDYVIIDTAPLLPVSDTAPIVTQADAVMLAARLKHSRRDTIGHAIDLIAQADARLLGVVTATSARELKQGYGYGYGYSARGVAAGRYIIAPRQAAPPVESGHQG